jgi:hypothetical protein
MRIPARRGTDPRLIRRTALASLILAGSITGALMVNDAASASTQQPDRAHQAQAAGGSIIVGADAAIEQLVVDDTLTRAQGNAIEQQINTGSIDPKQLVNSGTVTDAQMRTAANAIWQVKQANG